MSEAFDNPPVLGTVEGKVRKVVESMLADVDYYFMNWAQANVQLDQIKKPTIVYVLPATGVMDVSWGQIKDKPETFIAFVDNSELDFEGEENDCVIERMKRLAMRFVKALNESGLFEIIEGNLPYSVLYDHLDQNVTGIVIHPVIEELEGVLLCDIDARQGPEIEDEADPEEDTEDDSENGEDMLNDNDTEG